MTQELAGCVITNENNEILLIHRNTPKLIQWELPGGKVEEGESTEEAAIRENKEEIGVIVRLIKKVGIGEFDDSGVHWVYHWYRAKLIEGQPTIIEKDRYDDLGYFGPQYIKNNPDLFSINVINLVNHLRSV